MNAAVDELARLIATAPKGSPLPTPPEALVPKSVDEGFAVQRAILRQLGTAAGAWKIGAKTPTGPIQGSPLPAPGVHRGAPTLRIADYQPLGLELEIAFVLGGFAPRASAYTPEEVLAGVTQVCASIEIVTSRFADWPDLPPLLQLADLQNHGALVLGEPVPYDAALAYLSPQASLRHGTAEVAKLPAANPAGDPRRLLPWFVNHRLALGEAVEPGCVVTCGSYTGMHFTREPGEIVGVIAGLPPVRLALA